MTEEAILKFVSESFHSVWPLELLLVLSQEPRQAWQIDVLVRELRASEPVVIQSLEVLKTVQFVTVDRDGAYRFQPVSAKLAEMACELIALYSRKPRTVTRTIFSPSSDRIQTFADAFRIRKDT